MGPARFRGYAVIALLLGVLALQQHWPAQAQTVRRLAALTAVTTGTSAAINASDFSAISMYVSGTGTISSGIVTLEEADWDPVTGTAYTGTWASLGTITASSGAMLALHPTAPASYRWVRARISTNIGGGGNVTVSITGRP